MEKEKWYNDMESLKFVMHYDPQKIGYQFKAYPGFVNSKYMADDFVDKRGIVDKLLIDEHKKYLFSRSHLTDELIDNLRDGGPKKVFADLTQSLYDGYEAWKESYEAWKVYKICSSLSFESPDDEIREAGEYVIKTLWYDIQKVEHDTCNNLQELAENVAKGLLTKQKEMLLHPIKRT